MWKWLRALFPQHSRKNAFLFSILFLTSFSYLLLNFCRWIQHGLLQRLIYKDASPCKPLHRQKQVKNGSRERGAIKTDHEIVVFNYSDSILGFDEDRMDRSDHWSLTSIVGIALIVKVDENLDCPRQWSLTTVGNGSDDWSGRQFS